MANAPDSAAIDLDDRHFDAGALVRTASWGVGAAATLFLAVLAGLSDTGTPRVAVAVATLSGTPPKTATAAITTPAPVAAAQPQQPPQQLVTETRRLNEQVRLLAADRDRLVARIGTLERTLEDVTGSIRRQEVSVQPAPAPGAQPAAAPAAVVAIAPPAPAPWPSIPLQSPTTTPWNDPPHQEPQHETTSAVPPATAPNPMTPLPPPRPAASAPQQEPEAQVPAVRPEPVRQASLSKPEPPVARAGYGVDLGGAVSVERLRMLWNSLRMNEPRLLQGLRPITHMREDRRGGRPDVRLIVGPLRSADDAARLCAAILNAGRYCEPAVYAGQRLSAR